MKTVVEAKTPADRLNAQLLAMESRVAALKEVKPALKLITLGRLTSRRRRQTRCQRGWVPIM